MPEEPLREAARTLRAGGVVAHASEGVWGLACDPFQQAAVIRLLRIKGRAVAKGLIVIAGAADQFAPELATLDPDVVARIRAGWPGAVTWVVPNRRFPAWITGAHDSVAIRVPDHAQARALAEAFGGPIVSTSANRAGGAPGRTAQAVADALGSEIDYLLAGEIGTRQGPSRIFDAVGGAVIR